jgi:hypothetical protein
VSIAPFFSRRARERRSALRTARRQAPDSVVVLVLGHPLEPVAEDGFRRPLLLEASRSGVRIRSLDGSSEVWSADWADIPTITVDLLDARTALMTIADRRYYGVHASGTFGSSLQQLRRMVRAIEGERG